MEFSDVASVSGKGGLFKILSPTRNGAILESFDESGKKMVVGGQSKVSVLSEISIFTTDADGAKPLPEVLQKIHQEFKGDTDLSTNSDPEELKAFLKFVLPEYDESRVYVSDIKKLVSWYAILVKQAPELLVKKEEKKKEEKKPKEGEEKPQTATKKGVEPKAAAKAPKAKAPKKETKPKGKKEDPGS